ncbi:tyrosine-type recombinase/integrase [Ochrobactrum tritici]|uniref:Tyrosine-type recombinase/integrase n=1 Tax=Brucella tritici TaxID=94626 RepID=A0A7X6JA27_9HYPH|nr:tyrosine-type recombinase/integrase [Brucella tritici]
MLSKGMELSEKWGWRPKRSNPVDIDRYKENERSRIPDENEAARLLKALERASEEEPHFVGLVELLLFTGARLGEIKSAKWEWVTPDGLELPDSKTGKKTIPLSDLARHALQNIPRVKGNPYIIVGRRKGRHMVNVTKPWNRLMEAAQIKERLVRHDLRHFFATAGLSSGLNLDQLGNCSDTLTRARQSAMQN